MSLQEIFCRYTSTSVNSFLPFVVVSFSAILSCLLIFRIGKDGILEPLLRLPDRAGSVHGFGTLFVFAHEVDRGVLVHNLEFPAPETLDATVEQIALVGQVGLAGVVAEVVVQGVHSVDEILVLHPFAVDAAGRPVILDGHFGRVVGVYVVDRRIVHFVPDVHQELGVTIAEIVLAHDLTLVQEGGECVQVL